MRFFKRCDMQSMKLLLTFLSTHGFGHDMPETGHGPKDLGLFGETFAIDEQNLLEHIQEKLQALEQNGFFEKPQQTIKEKVSDSLHHPPPVEGIKHTKTQRTFTYDPSIIVKEDLKDHTGKVFYPKGTRVNPLTFKSLTRPLLFIDGDEPSHIKWAQNQLNQSPNAKIIFVKGSPFEVMKTFPEASVFYDQGGALVRKLGIAQVPAKVTQVGKLLEITEAFPDA